MVLLLVIADKRLRHPEHAGCLSRILPLKLLNLFNSNVIPGIPHKAEEVAPAVKAHQQSGREGYQQHNLARIQTLIQHCKEGDQPHRHGKEQHGVLQDRIHIHGIEIGN